MFRRLAAMLDSLESEKGPKAKKELLKHFVKDSDFVWMARVALNQGHSFGVDDIPPFEQNTLFASDADGIYLIENLMHKTGVSDAFKRQLFDYMNTSPERYQVLSRILRKDLRCGVGAKTINSVSPGLVYRVPYQRCGSYDKIGRIDYPAYLQRKADAMFVYSLPKTGEFLTRQGNRFKIPDNPVTPYHQELPDLDDKILIGELGVIDEYGKFIDRAESNGHMNSFIKGEGDQGLADRVRFFVWGYLTQAEFDMNEGRISYRETFQNLEKWIPHIDSPIKLIETWIVRDFNEAQAKFKTLIAAGEEGGILKSWSPRFVWRDEDTSDFQFKMKAEAEAEFEVIDAYYGDPKKKYAGMLGGISVRSSCGQIVSDCGMGFTDAERKKGLDYWRNVKIVTVKFNGITTDRNRPDVFALDHPRFIEVRSDKSEADTLDYCRKELLGK